mmetsp:Transcript_121831/g.389579  ORF Transcript_121831/g.389579 Transcript_121831/m.389579 type:complete len:486 (+) Transcript_121831:24-1481(+)
MMAAPRPVGAPGHGTRPGLRRRLDFAPPAGPQVAHRTPTGEAGGAEAIRELSATILGLLTESSGLSDIAGVGSTQGPAVLAREGRRALARALGQPLLASGSLPGFAKSSSSRRPRSAQRRGGGSLGGSGGPGPTWPRCAELDSPVLAEACGILGLDQDPLPQSRTSKAAADQLLAVAGALGCIVAARPDDNFGRAAAWALGGLSRLLSELSASRRTAADDAHIVCRPATPMRRPTSASGFGQRPRGGPLAACVPAVRAGDRVLAHWLLPDGFRSLGVEDADVLGVSREQLLARLRYIDGLELDVPLDWIAVSPDGSIIKRASSDVAAVVNEPSELGSSGTLRYSEELPTAASEDLEKADYPLLRLMQAGAPTAELCARIRDLYDRPRGAGMLAVTAAFRVGLTTGPPAIQRACMEVLCSFCRGGPEDAALARSLANSALLSGLRELPLTPQQAANIRRAEALSEVQRYKLLALVASQDPRWSAVW